jgi:hypothetical protein
MRGFSKIVVVVNEAQVFILAFFEAAQVSEQNVHLETVAEQGGHLLPLVAETFNFDVDARVCISRNTGTERLDDDMSASYLQHGGGQCNVKWQSTTFQWSAMRLPFRGYN